MRAGQDVKLPRRFGQGLMVHVLGLTARLAFRIYGRWQVIGRENVPREGGVLIAANHASYLDPLLGWAAMYGYRRMWGIAKIELWSDKRLAYFMDCIDGIPVRRGTADRTMLRTVLGLLGQGKAVGLFPEGTRSRDGLLNPAQPGVALMVQKTGVPVVPAALIGTYEMLPRGGKGLKRARLKVVFGKPLVFARDASRETITTTIMEQIAALMTAHGKPMEPPGADRALPAAEED